MKGTFSSSKLGSCLVSRGPRENFLSLLWDVSLEQLLLLGIQIYQMQPLTLENNEGPKNYFTINKKIEGGALLNLAKKEESFDKKELDTISQLNGVQRIGGFVRNKFPITLYIWPSGKIGFGQPPKPIYFLSQFLMNFSTSYPRNGNGKKMPRLFQLW